MPRGGYRRPSDKTPKVSGPGKASKRTDGMEKPRTPNVGDSELVYGDRQRLEAAQNIAPRQSGGASPPAKNPSPSRADARGAPLDPSYLFGRPSDNPQEPITSGMDMGAGPGSEVLPGEMQTDPMELIYTLALIKYGSEDASRLLSERRAAKMQTYGGNQGSLGGGGGSDAAALAGGLSDLTGAPPTEEAL